MSPFKWNPEAIRGMARDWLDEHGLEVEVRHGGSAIIRPPDEDFIVELEFALSPALLRKQVMDLNDAGPILDGIKRITVSGDQLPEQLDLVKYGVALTYTLLSEPIASSMRVPKGKPERGRSLDLDFYRQIVALHGLLQAKGSSNPSAVIAELKGVEPKQARVWVSRGKAYLKKRGE